MHTNVNGVYRTIREQIVEQLRKEVVSGVLTEGQSLREQALARRFGVSRGPIRDALLQLTQEGLLLAQPHCGVKVGRAPSEAIRALVISTRRQVERHALDRVFDELTENDLAAWDAILQQFHRACLSGNQAGLIQHDMAFHRAIIERTGDADLLAIWLALVLRMRLRYTRHDNLLESYSEHAEILEHIRQGNKQAALDALEYNIQ